MSTEENKATVRRWVEAAWNTGDLALADELYPPTYILHDPARPVQGPEGLKQFVSMFRTAFPDLHFTLEDIIAEGEKVVWRYTARGTHQGELMGIPPTGIAVTVSGMVCSRFSDGKWVEDWSNYDALGMLQQLGVIPAMG